jgi:hypothetical protein
VEIYSDPGGPTTMIHKCVAGDAASQAREPAGNALTIWPSPSPMRARAQQLSTKRSRCSGRRERDLKAGLRPSGSSPTLAATTKMVCSSSGTGRSARYATSTRLRPTRSMRWRFGDRPRTPTTRFAHPPKGEEGLGDVARCSNRQSPRGAGTHVAWMKRPNRNCWQSPSSRFGI